MEFSNILRDVFIATVLAVFAERVVNRVKKWWYIEEDVNINDLHFEFIPEIEEGTGLIKQTRRNPKVFKYFSDVE